jgi:ribosome biogenesis protein MAK21
LFAGELIQNQPDLHQFTLMHFLDRFVYRNAKKTATTKGQSIMQPLSGSRRDGGIMFTKGSGIKSDAIPLNSERFLQKKEDDVEADEVFFHKYFNQKAVTATKKSKKDKANADDEDGEEDEVWRAMMSSIPGGLDNEDDDEGLDNSDDDEEMRALLMSDDEEDGEEDMAELESDQGEPMDDEDDEEDIELELMNASSMDEEEDEQVEEPVETNKRSAFDEPSGSKKKKQKKEALPTFASYEDYAKLIEQDLSD